MQPRRSLSLRDLPLSLKILLPSLLFTALTIGAFALLLTSNQRAQSEAQLAAKASNFIDLFASANVNPLWNFHLDEVEQNSQAFFNVQDIVAVQVKDYQGTVCVDLQKPEQAGENRINLSRLVRRQGEAIGEVQLTFSDYRYAQYLKRIINRLTMLCLAIFAVLAIVVLAASQFALTPLRGVLSAISHISTGDYQYRIPYKGQDEIGQLAANFNDMAQQITTLQQQAMAHAAKGRELEIAKNIQLSLLPQDEQLVASGHEISAAMVPAEEVGGDYYDVIRSPGGSLWLTIGDVTGHGLLSGLIMMMCQVALNTLIRSRPKQTPEEILIQANKVLHANIRHGLQSDHHMTLSLLKEESAGCYHYAGAHEIILIHRQATAEVEQLPTKGMWLGVIEDISKPTQKFSGQFQLNQGDLLLLYTDGVIELKNKAKEQYDIHRLSTFLQNHATLPVTAIKEALLAELNSFMDRQNDDITFLVMRQQNKPAGQS